MRKSILSLLFVSILPVPFALAEDSDPIKIVATTTVLEDQRPLGATFDRPGVGATKSRNSKGAKFRGGEKDGNRRAQGGEGRGDTGEDRAGQVNRVRECDSGGRSGSENSSFADRKHLDDILIRAGRRR